MKHQNWQLFFLAPNNWITYLNMTIKKGSKNERMLLVVMLISMCIWGISWSSAKVLSDYGSATEIACIRFAFVPLALFPFMKIMKIDLRIKKEGIPHLLGAMVFMILYSIAFFEGLKMGDPGKAGVLVTTTIPLLSYLLGVIINKKLPTRTELIGLGLGLFAGCILLNVFLEPKQVFASGNIYFLLGALNWAIIGRITSQANKFGTPIAFNFWMNVLIVIGFLLIADLKEVLTIVKTGDTKFWLNTLYFGFINTAFATTFYLYATAKIGAEKASSFIFIVPATAMIGSWILLDETIETHTIIGGIVAIIAVFIVNGRFLKNKRS